MVVLLYSNLKCSQNWHYSMYKYKMRSGGLGSMVSLKGLNNMGVVSVSLEVTFTGRR